MRLIYPRIDQRKLFISVTLSLSRLRNKILASRDCPHNHKGFPPTQYILRKRSAVVAHRVVYAEGKKPDKRSRRMLKSLPSTCLIYQ